MTKPQIPARHSAATPSFGIGHSDLVIHSGIRVSELFLHSELGGFFKCRNNSEWRPLKKPKPGNNVEKIAHQGPRSHTKNAHFNRENKSILRDPSCPFVGNFDFELNGMSYSKGSILIAAKAA
jgi:hypothetical protein